MGLYPSIIHLNRIFHEINPPFLGIPPIYGNPHLEGTRSQNTNADHPTLQYHSRDIVWDAIAGSHPHKGPKMAKENWVM